MMTVPIITMDELYMLATSVTVPLKALLELMKLTRELGQTYCTNIDQNTDNDYILNLFH